MAVPLSKLVLITPRVLTAGINGLNFNGLFLTTSDQVPVDTLLTFSSAGAVGEYFGYTSAQYRTATVYFNGYDNSLTKPSTCFFYRHVASDAPAFVRGSQSPNYEKMLLNLRKVTNGTLHMTIGPEELQLEGVDLSGCNSHSDVAQVLEDAINDAGYEHDIPAWEKARVRWSSLTKTFQFSAGVAGPGVPVDYGVGPLADLLRISHESNAVLSHGAAARTWSETLDNVLTHTGNFVSYGTIEEITSLQEAESLASWANNKFNEGSQFLYVWHTSDVTLDDSATSALNSTLGTARTGRATVAIAGSGREIAEAFKDAQWQGVAGVYGDSRYAAFIMGAVASIDWNQPGSTITFAMKTQSGLEANINDVNTWETLDELKLTGIANYAARNDNFKLSTHGKMFGSFRFIDTYVNSTWLNNQLQTRLADGFTKAGRVAYNQTGMSLIRAWCQPVFDQARMCGVIDTGVKLDAGQKNQLMNEAGRDISTELSNNGYYMLIGEATSTQRASRESPPCQVWYTYGGSVHSLVVPVTAVV